MTLPAIQLLSHAEHLVTIEGHEWSMATLVQAARERMTPILMTALVTGLGLLPLAIGSGQAGRDTGPDGRGHPRRPDQFQRRKRADPAGADVALLEDRFPLKTASGRVWNVLFGFRADIRQSAAISA